MKKIWFGQILVIALLIFSQSASAEITPSNRIILEIDPNMSLDQIVHKIYPDAVNLWPEIKKHLITLNPDSFYPGSDRLIKGSSLKLVEANAGSGSRVGYVVNREGRVTAIDLNGAIRQLDIKFPVYEGDKITTGLNSSVDITMDDGAEIYLKEDSVIKISSYIITADADAESSSILHLIRGALRKITGLIRSSSQADYQVQTGLATIGVRGTEYLLKLCKLDDCSQTVNQDDPDAKLHAVVLDGAITLTSEDDKQIEVKVGDYGTASSADTLVLDDDAIPVGLLDSSESERFDTINRNQIWGLVFSILLIGIGI